MRVVTVRAGAWRFTPGLWPTLAALCLVALTVFLGNWQNARADAKRVLQARHDAALNEAPLRVGRSLLERDHALHRRLEVEGVFDDAHTILLDNRVQDGVAGYHVLTPLRVTGSRFVLLVNRGWVPVGPSRARLPLPPTPAGRVRLEGLAADPRTRYVELADATPQGRVWQNLDFALYARRSGLALQPLLLLQTSDSGDGLARAWPRPDAGVAMHVGYAFQWYGLAATLVVLWLVTNLRREPRDGAPTRSEEDACG